MSDQIIKIHPALCRNRGCNRPVHTRAIAAYAADRALSHELVDPSLCIWCNAKYLREMRAERSDGGLIACVPWDEDEYPPDEPGWSAGRGRY